MTSTKHRDVGGVADGRRPSYFHCAYCGASERSTAIEYGTLGFARCPDCGADHGP
jgi:transcription elongation factor Elf1